MKHQSIILANLKGNNYVITSIVCLLFILCSCNPKKEKTTENVTNPRDTINAATAPPAALTGNLYTLKLTKVQYDSLKKYNGSQKTILQFIFNTSDSKSPSLVAYPAKAQNKFYSNNTSSSFNPAELTTDVSSLQVQPKMILGDQQISYSAIDKYLESAEIDTNNPYTLIFSPALDNTNHIFYKITVTGAKATAVELQTNPSPPKNAD